MLEIFNLSFKTSFDNIFNIFKIVLGSMSDTNLLQTIQVELYRVVDYDSKWSTKLHNDCMLGNLLNFTFKTSYDNFINFLNSIRDHVRYRAFETLQIEL